MRFHTVAILTGATAVTASTTSAPASKTTSLFLPGYQGHDLHASVIGSQADTTTYVVSCPQATNKACKITGQGGLTVTAAPTAYQLVDVDQKGNTALVSCNVAGTTSASCSASSGSLTVQHTLAQSHINWQPVTITECHTSTPTPTSTPTSTPSSTRTPTSTPKSSSTPVSSYAGRKSKTAASSTPLVASSPVATQPAASPAGPTDGTAATTESAAPSSSTPATAGAAAVVGNSWALGGAALLAYVLA
ncbi:hypothetical protein N7492_009384 [Penicillium capsulatum]|uniref:GPI anchored cell wall protein n=1 Tax=Penicillium capsulatum TaxID=69766 RepID=A0A9W9LGT7_9EURO|nr:hypothetical protein N7492_009384 [Penicillium capsulatum]KAJ6106777.1 hypothetical protein N7512_010294 [Penicillium capsulatum]